jgi:colanic acid/amylovoran biosynthesis glycosyltransferase
MRVIEVTYSSPAETFIQRHVQALHSALFPVTLVARSRAGNLSGQASLGDVNHAVSIAHMPNFDHLGLAGKLASLRYLTKDSLFSSEVSPISQKVLLGYFERLKPELIHFHTASLAVMMAWIPMALGIPYTLSLRGSDVQVIPLHTQARQDALVSALKAAASVHTVCNALGNLVESWYGCRINYHTIYTVSPVAQALPTFRCYEQGEPLRLLSIGRFVWRKDFSNLLHAVHDLRHKHGQDVRLALVGSGPELDHLLYLRKLLRLETVVDLPGKLPYERIQSLFQQAHVYIQSSIAEGLSNSLVEAMANGLPVFATDVGGTNEIIEDGVTGFLLPSFAPHDWAEKLLLTRDIARMNNARVAGYEKARDFFSAERHAREFVAFYKGAGSL